jgi:hypothetical protein
VSLSPNQFDISRVSAELQALYQCYVKQQHAQNVSCTVVHCFKDLKKKENKNKERFLGERAGKFIFLLKHNSVF